MVIEKAPIGSVVALDGAQVVVTGVGLVITAGGKATVVAPGTEVTLVHSAKDAAMKLLAAIAPPAPILFNGMTEPELKATFEMVCDPNDWRAPIRKTLSLPRETAEVALNRIRTAIEFYTATETQITYIGYGEWAIFSVGYRNGPAN